MLLCIIFPSKSSKTTYLNHKHPDKRAKLSYKWSSGGPPAPIGIGPVNLEGCSVLKLFFVFFVFHLRYLSSLLFVCLFVCLFAFFLHAKNKMPLWRLFYCLQDSHSIFLEMVGKGPSFSTVSSLRPCVFIRTVPHFSKNSWTHPLGAPFFFAPPWVLMLLLADEVHYHHI